MTESKTMNLIGIDPGTDTIGISVFEIHVDTYEIIRCSAKTFSARKYMDDYWVLGSDKDKRLNWIFKLLTQLFEAYQPFALAVESNFMNINRPMAYGALVELVATIRAAYREVRPSDSIQMITPSQGKASVKADRSAKDNTLLPFVEKELGALYQGEVPLSSLDGHSLDSLVVGYALYTQFLSTYKGQSFSKEILP